MWRKDRSGLWVACFLDIGKLLKVFRLHLLSTMEMVSLPNDFIIKNGLPVPLTGGCL